MISLDQKFNELELLEMPVGLHENILRQVAQRKVQRLVWFGIIALSINVLVSSWHLWLRLLETESLSVIKVMFDGFEMSWDYLGHFALVLWQFLPLSSIIIWSLNIILLIAACRLLVAAHKSVLRSPKLSLIR